LGGVQTKGEERVEELKKNGGEIKKKKRTPNETEKKLKRVELKKKKKPFKNRRWRYWETNRGKKKKNRREGAVKCYHARRNHRGIGAKKEQGGKTRKRKENWTAERAAGPEAEEGPQHGGRKACGEWTGSTSWLKQSNFRTTRGLPETWGWEVGTLVDRNYLRLHIPPTTVFWGGTGVRNGPAAGDKKTADWEEQKGSHTVLKNGAGPKRMLTRKKNINLSRRHQRVPGRNKHQSLVLGVGGTGATTIRHRKRKPDGDP